MSTFKPHNIPGISEDLLIYSAPLIAEITKNLPTKLQTDSAFQFEIELAEQGPEAGFRGSITVDPFSIYLAQQCYGRGREGFLTWRNNIPSMYCIRFFEDLGVEVPDILELPIDKIHEELNSLLECAQEYAKTLAPDVFSGSPSEFKKRTGISVHDAYSCIAEMYGLNKDKDNLAWVKFGSGTFTDDYSKAFEKIAPELNPITQLVYMSQASLALIEKAWLSKDYAKQPTLEYILYELTNEEIRAWAMQFIHPDEFNEKMVELDSYVHNGTKHDGSPYRTSYQLFKYYKEEYTSPGTDMSYVAAHILRCFDVDTDRSFLLSVDPSVVKANEAAAYLCVVPAKVIPLLHSVNRHGEKYILNAKPEVPDEEFAEAMLSEARSLTAEEYFDLLMLEA